MFNSPITITGRIVHDPDFRDANGHGVLRLRLASSRSYQKDGKWQDVDRLFINVEAWGKLAANAHQSLVKGTAVIVQGMLYTDSWEANNGGENSKRQEVRVRAISIGLDMNHYVVGFRDSRPSQVHIPEGVDVPEIDTENYQIVEPRGNSNAEHIASSGVADAQSPRADDLVGATTSGNSEEPGF